MDNITVYFPKEPLFKADPESDLLELAEDFQFFVSGLSLEKAIIINDKYMEPFLIPKGYKYNCASIPRLFWPIIGSSFDPEFILPALVHDYLYLMHSVTRKVADEILLILLLQNAGKVKARIRKPLAHNRAYIMWAAVRVFACYAWPNNKKERLEKLYWESLGYV